MSFFSDWHLQLLFKKEEKKKIWGRQKKKKEKTVRGIKLNIIQRAILVNCPEYKFYQVIKSTKYRLESIKAEHD